MRTSQKKRRKKRRSVFSFKKKSRRRLQNPTSEDNTNNSSEPTDAPSITDDDIIDFYNLDDDNEQLEEFLHYRKKLDLEIIQYLNTDYKKRSVYGEHNKEIDKYLLVHMHDLIYTISKSCLCCQCQSPKAITFGSKFLPYDHIWFHFFHFLRLPLSHMWIQIYCPSTET